MRYITSYFNSSFLKAKFIALFLYKKLFKHIHDFFSHIYGMIKFYVTFRPNEGGYFGFKDPFQIIQKLVFS